VNKKINFIAEKKKGKWFILQGFACLFALAGAAFQALQFDK